MNPDWQAQRSEMVAAQIRARGILDPGVLCAMSAVPRHEFVPAEDQHRSYDDVPLQIGFGQTISQPYIVAYMTERLQVQPTHRVLEVGTGSGYQSAVLAELAAMVFSVEIQEDLQLAASRRLMELGYRNIALDVRNGYEGWPEMAPFDRIMVTAGAPFIPPELEQQLAPGGRMVIPVGEADRDQVLKLVTKSTASEITVQDLIPVRFVPLV